MIPEIVSQLAVSIGTSTLIGFLFNAWLNSRFAAMQSTIDDQKDRIKELEKASHNTLSRDDHFEIRKEDKEGLEKQITEMKKDIREMPDKIVSLLKQFIK